MGCYLVDHIWRELNEKELEVDRYQIMLMKALALYLTHGKHSINISFISSKQKSFYCFDNATIINIHNED